MAKPCRYRIGSAATRPKKLRKNAISNGCSSLEASRMKIAIAPNSVALATM
jgi:hypothetical protein